MFSNLKGELWPKEYNLVLLLGVFIRLLTAFFSEGFFHPDEQFQILEYLHKVRGGENVTLAWEWSEQMRPLLQVYIYKYLLYPFQLFFSTFTQAFILRLGHVILGTFAFLFFAKEFFRFSNLEARYHKLFFVYWAFSGLLPYFLVRTSSESLGSIFFLLVLGWMFQLIRLSHWKTALLFGVSVGLCFNVRFQNAFAIAGLLIWGLIFQYRVLSRNFLPILTGYLLVTALSVCLDRTGYGSWVFTPYEYFEQNILQDKASNFGVSYWGHYFEFGLLINFPISALVFIPWLFFVVTNFRSPISWATTAFFVAHSFVGHKEYRFISMIFWLAPVYLVHWHQLLFQNKSRLEKSWTSLYFLFSGLYLAAFGFFPVRSEIPFLKKMLNVMKPGEILVLMPEANDPSVILGYKIHFYMPENLPVVPFDAQTKSPAPNAVYFSDRSFGQDPPFQNCETLLQAPGPFLQKIFERFPSLVKSTKYRAKYLWKCKG